MNIKSNHTKLPWAKDYGGTLGHIKSVFDTDVNTPTVCRYKGKSSIEICGTLMNKEEKEANAELIVMSVNNFYPLFYGLKELYNAIDSSIELTPELLKKISSIIKNIEP